ncbi:MAG: hypothetical protein IKP43_08935 [Bacteroidaceae bacterium]|nr:hypothetical protein [Bacteroidaceae bacterium]
MTVQIEIKNQVFPLELENNPTALDFYNKLPLQVRLVRSLSNEFTCTLQEPLVDDSEGATSRIRCCSVYYFSLWNAFVLVLKNVNLSPYKVVHIGDIKGDITPLFDKERVVAVNITSE